VGKGRKVEGFAGKLKHHLPKVKGEHAKLRRCFGVFLVARHWLHQLQEESLIVCYLLHQFQQS
jgi:hypothetical protein